MRRGYNVVMDKKIRKQATENPLLDEIIYQCQIMMSGIILKDEQRADENETVESLKQSDIYANIIRGTYNFTMFINHCLEANK